MTKKIAFHLSAILILGIVLTACQPAAAISELDCPRPDIWCVGLVAEVENINNNTINRQAWEGVQQAQTEKFADWIRYIETADLKDYYQNITSLAEAGYDIVVTVGEQNAQFTNTAANSYPGTLFIGVDQAQTETRANLARLVFKDAETSFLAGALAAQMTKSNIIAGIFSGEPGLTDSSYREGFEAGAKYVNPQILIISPLQTQDLASSEAEWGAVAAARAIENGADVVFGAGSRISDGTLYETAKHPGVLCIGVDTDQWATNPKAHTCLVSSAVKLISPGVLELIELAKQESFPSGDYFGAAGLAPYHDFDSLVTQGVKDKITHIAKSLDTGAITTDFLP